MSPIFLSIIIPAYNETDNFNRGVLEQVVHYLNNFSKTWEVIIIDDGSTDKSTRLIEKFIKNKKQWFLYKNQHQGKAAAITLGVNKSKGENILFTDFDQATPLGEVEKLLPFLKKGYDFIIGSREVKGAKREREPFYRHLMGKVFNLVVKFIAFQGIQDTQCGFKLLKGNVAKDLFSNLIVYKSKNIKDAFTGAFDVELLFLAQKRGYKIAEVPVFWQHYKTKRVNPIKDSLKMFIDVLFMRFYDLLGKYDKKN